MKSNKAMAGMNGATIGSHGTLVVTPVLRRRECRLSFVPGGAFMIAACIAVSLVTTPKPESELEGLIWNKESLHMPPQLRATMRGLRRPGLWWAVVTVMVLYFYFRYP